MPSVEILLAFFLAASVFACTPGPSLLYTAAQTIARGRNGGLMAALGIHLGGYLHVVAAALGLSLLLHSVPVLFAGIQLLGACYVLWLGVQMLCDTTDAYVSINQHTDGEQPDGEKYTATLWQSVCVEALNPKTAIFYIAFLPQFTDPGASLPLSLQLLVLGTIVNLMFSSADIVCVLLASTVVDLADSSATTGRNLRRLGGVILIVLAVYLAFNQN